MKLPKAILLDLDDTILNDSGSIDSCWEEACVQGAAHCGLQAETLLEGIKKSSKWYWSDEERHRVGRLDLRTARIEVVRLALSDLRVGGAELAEIIGGTYHDRREASLEIFPDAIDTIRWFREQRCKLALLTNGNGASQRRKIERFGLQDYFDAILIEGEVGFGKPDERIYRLALDTLGVAPSDSWMAGDKLEWDVIPPQRLGVFAIWIDASGGGHNHSIQPDRTVRRLSDLKISPERLQ